MENVFPHGPRYGILDTEADVGGDVEKIGYDQYKISGEKLGLVYHRDGVFGITVIYPSNITKEEAAAFLSNYMY